MIDDLRICGVGPVTYSGIKVPEIASGSDPLSSEGEETTCWRYVG